MQVVLQVPLAPRPEVPRADVDSIMMPDGIPACETQHVACKQVKICDAVAELPIAAWVGGPVGEFAVALVAPIQRQSSANCRARWERRAGVDEGAYDHGVVRFEFGVRNRGVHQGFERAGDSAEACKSGYREVGSGEDVQKDLVREAGEDAKGRAIW